MATRGELTSYVLERLGVSSGRTDFVTQVKAQLYREYVALSRELELSRDVSNLVFVADDHFVDLPDDWLKTRTLRVGTTILREVTMEVLSTSLGAQALVVGDVGRISTYVFMPPSRIYLDWAPEANDAAGAELFYVVKPALWTTDSDTPDFLPEEYQDLLAESVIYRMGMNQEEFATHSAGALQAMGLVRGRLEEEMKLRTGDGATRITRRVYG